MELKAIKDLFDAHKEIQLSHRYITNAHIVPLLNKLGLDFEVSTIGHSVLNEPIYAVKIGHGKTKILMWSQMHGNESTTTKALFDLFNTLTSSNHEVKNILEACTLCIIPILNPDGANVYTRVNANEVDLNRDAQLLTQPESLVLKLVFEKFKPHFCYNLHGQRTIFSAGHTNKPATVSFLSPAQDKDCTVTPNRKVAMEVIAAMNAVLQKTIPNQVGVYDDAFNLNCVGDTFQSKNVPTILFEAGHFKEDYARDMTREYIYYALLGSLDYIAKHDVDGTKYQPYFEIPENEKLFLDVIIRNARVDESNNVVDIGVLFQERLIADKVQFIPKVDKIENLSMFYGHKEYNASVGLVLSGDNTPLKVGNENDFVILNNEKIALLPK